MTIEQPSASWKDYELIDSGDFSKLERFGPYVTIRPEPKALWPKSLSEADWKRIAHTEFKPGAGFGKAGKEDSGTWAMLHKMQEQWTISYPSVGFNLRLGLTSFKHVGVFPEQAPNWDFIRDQVRRIVASGQAKGPADTLVTHAGARPAPRGIRWIIEDAMKFARREARRGNLYQGVILDPPAYGHGPDGERWKLDECLYDLLRECASILAPEKSFLVLSLYSNGYSAVLADTLVRDAFGTKFASIDYGELVLCDRAGRALPLSVFSRMTR